MTKSIKAYQFWVNPVEGSTKMVRDAVAAIDAGSDGFGISRLEKRYLAQHLKWDARRNLVTGTVYLIRSSNLPAAINEERAGPLPIDDKTDLGEPMCFAFHPEVGVALIHYNHVGPRHQVLATVIEHVLPDVPILVEPVLRRDMLETLDRKPFLRSIEFGLQDPNGIRELRAMGGSIAHAMSMLADLGGINIKVSITMGHSRGEGLRAGARRLGEKLAKLGAIEVEGHARISAIKVGAAENEDAPIEHLDMLHAREEITFEVGEVGRTIDVAAACRYLADQLQERLGELRIQAGNR